MNELHLGKRVKAWRRANGVNQALMAQMLGVSQPTISRWEAGVDIPSAQVCEQLQHMIALGLRDGLEIDRRFLSARSSLEAIFDFDGVRLQATSGGLRRMWPEFCALIGQAFENRIIGEARIAIDDLDLRRSIIKGDVAIVVGVSDRHLDLKVDFPVKHRWVTRFRMLGHRVLTDIAFEPCGRDVPCGIEEILRLDDLTAG